MLDVRIVPYGPSATDELAAAIRAAKSSDRLAPVTVLVPSNLAGLAARRALGDRHGGVINVRFLVPARFAELVLSAVMPEGVTAPMGMAVRHEAVRSVLAAHPHLFGTVAEHPSTVDAVIELFDYAPLLNAAATDSWVARVLELATPVADRLRGLRTQQEVLVEAAHAVATDGTTLAEIGRVV